MPPSLGSALENARKTCNMPSCDIDNSDAVPTRQAARRTLASFLPAKPRASQCERECPGMAPPHPGRPNGGPSGWATRKVDGTTQPPLCPWADTATDVCLFLFLLLPLLLLLLLLFLLLMLLLSLLFVRVEAVAVLRRLALP